MKALLATLVIILTSLPATAAEPNAGTLNLDQLQLEYVGGPFVNANITHQSDNGESGPTCLPPALECDEFSLKLDFPEAIEDIYPSAIVRINWAWEDISGQGLVDFDCWVYDGEGNLQETSGAGSNNPESAGFVLYGGVHEYTLTCAPFFAAGDSYTGRVEVVLGEPVETEASDSNGLRSILVPDGESQDAGAEESARTGSGALGSLLLSLCVLMLARRRV